MNGHLRLLTCSLILTIIASPVVAQNVLLPSGTKATATTATTSTATTASSSASQPAPSGISLDSLLGANSTASPAPTPTQPSAANGSGYVPAAAQAVYIQSASTQVAALQQVVNSLQQSIAMQTAAGPKSMPSMTPQQYNQFMQNQTQQLAQMTASLAAAQQQLNALQAGPIRISDLVGTPIGQ